MNWTTEVPTKAGIYFAYDKKCDDIMVVYVYFDEFVNKNKGVYTDGCVLVFGTGSEWNLSDYSHWCPVEFPDKPDVETKEERKNNV